MAAGDPIAWSDIATRVGEDDLIADSSTWDDTPEVAAMSVTATLVNTRRYRIWFTGRVSTDVAGDYTGLRIREDAGVAGTQLVFSGNIYLPTTTGNGFPTFLYAEYTATADGAKTFTLTGARQAGTGTAHRIRASANSPAYLIVERIIT